MQKLVIIDTLGLLYRVHFKAPSIRNKQGQEIGTVLSFMARINDIVEDLEADYLLFAMDNKGKTIRDKQDSNYKSNRKAMDKDLARQLLLLEQTLNRSKQKLIRVKNFEADDVIASVVEDTADQDLKIFIVAYDKDFNQLLEPKRVSIYNPSTRMKTTYKTFENQYGFSPENFIDYQALLGDSSDNVKGCKGIGDKTARTLIQDYNNIRQIYEAVHNPKHKDLSDRVRELLKAGEQEVIASYKAVTLYRDIYTLPYFKRAFECKDMLDIKLLYKPLSKRVQEFKSYYANK